MGSHGGAEIVGARQVDSHFCKIKRRCSFLSNFAQSVVENRTILGTQSSRVACRDFGSRPTRGGGHGEEGCVGGQGREGGADGQRNAIGQTGGREAQSARGCAANASAACPGQGRVAARRQRRRRRQDKGAASGAPGRHRHVPRVCQHGRWRRGLGANRASQAHECHIRPGPRGRERAGPARRVRPRAAGAMPPHACTSSRNTSRHRRPYAPCDVCVAGI